jgi:predicted metal-dependent phosphoesterase TrpH
MFKVDLHTHSITSPDGGITRRQYIRALESGVLDTIAVTDHNQIDFAVELHKELGDKIIVGEEIMTSHGEIIGLYLSQLVSPGLSPQATIEAIHSQGGIVYIPHPFETYRKGLHPAILEDIKDTIDIMEVCNGRAFLQNRSQQAAVWAKLNHIVSACSSDAHGWHGLGKTYNSLNDTPIQVTLKNQLSMGKSITDRPSIRALMYPKYHLLRKKIMKGSK